MASGNTSATGIYGGFSYLNSPTDKNNPPRSPRLSSKSDHRNHSNGVGEEEEDLQPFSYLAPNSPLDRAPSPLPVFDQRESYDNNKRLPRESDGSTTLPSPHHHNSNRIGSDPAYYTSAREFSNKNSGDNDRVIGELYSNRLIDDKDKKSAYIVPDYPNSIQNPGYELSPTDPNKGGTSGFIPRARVDGSSSSSGVYNQSSDRNYNNDYYNNYQSGYEGGGGLNNDKVRPVSRDSYLDSNHRKSKGGCSCCTVCLVIVLVILALGAGFAAGWFASQAVNGTSSSDVTTTTESPSVLPSSSPPLDTTTTTQSPVNPSTTTTTSTTSNNPTTTSTTSTTTTTTAEPTTQSSNLVTGTA